MSACCRKILNESPFINGYLHQSIKEASANCNNGGELSKCSKGTYYFGRFVRLIVSVPGTLIDVALQILQCIPMTLEILIITAETKCRKITIEQTCTSILYTHGLSRFIGGVRYYTTSSEPFNLAQDLGCYSKKEIINENGHHTSRITYFCGLAYEERVIKDKKNPKFISETLVSRYRKGLIASLKKI